MSIPTLHVANGLATIQLNRPKSLNALTAADYEFLSETLRKVDKMPDVLCTVLQATGRAFCSGTDVGARHTDDDSNKSARRKALSLGMQSNTDLSDAAWLAVPFSFLGLSSEQNASVTFVNRMGLAKANEALLWGKKITAEELVRNGFVNEIFPADDTPSFHRTARAYLLDRLDGLDPAALLSSKRLIQTALHEKNDPRAVNFRESFAQAERFAGGVPTQRFGQLARKEIKHRL